MPLTQFKRKFHCAGKLLPSGVVWILHEIKYHIARLARILVG